MESTQVHTVFVRKKRKKIKENLEHLDFLHSWTYNPHKYIYNYKNDHFFLKKKLINLYCI